MRVMVGSLCIHAAHFKIIIGRRYRVATLPSQSPAEALIGLHRPVQIGAKRLASKGVLTSCKPAHTKVSAD